MTKEPEVLIKDEEDLIQYAYKVCRHSWPVNVLCPQH